MKFLKTIRFDPSDVQVFDHAANPDEWAIPGGFEFSSLKEAQISGKLKQAFSNGFLSVETFGFSTFVSVAEILQNEREVLTTNLVERFINEFDAPSYPEARLAADAELNYVSEMCEDVPINSIFTVRRFFDEQGEIREEFRVVDAPGLKPHTRVWEVLEDE